MNNSIIDQIFNNLGNTTGDYYGETFYLSESNNFTPLDTPGLWGHDPSDNNYWQPPNNFNVLSQNCRKLLLAIEDTVASAETYLDITTLWHTNGPHGGFPDGFFFDALKKGFQRLNASNQIPTVRILIGVPAGVVVALWDMSGWLDKLISIDSNITVYIATNQTRTASSWNHSKIIAADGKACIVGGHNMWSTSYMSFAPINDVSAKFEGSGAIAAHQFCNKLWTKPFDSIKWHKHKYKSANHSGPVFNNFPNYTPGTTRTLALGRLGAGLVKKVSLNSNASVFARVSAILSAKNEIRISQQGLGFQLIISDISSFNIATMAALAKAIHSGVNVKLVVSNDGAKDGGSDPYSGTPINTQLLYLAGFLEWELTHGFPSAANPKDYFNIPKPRLIKEMVLKFLKNGSLLSQQTIKLMNQRVWFCSLRFSTQGGDWKYKSKKRIPGNHAKIYIIDNTNFYIGSDNMYRSGSNAGLQEFGYMVEGQEETNNFCMEYWDKLWKYSSMNRHF
jgi:hypothetical protein